MIATILNIQDLSVQIRNLVSLLGAQPAATVGMYMPI